VFDRMTTLAKGDAKAGRMVPWKSTGEVSSVMNLQCRPRVLGSSTVLATRPIPFHDVSPKFLPFWAAVIVPHWFTFLRIRT
jgi:hypothetical protein